MNNQKDTIGISKRVANISISAIKKMPILAEKISGCVSLGQGIPSFPTPRFIRNGVIKALQKEDFIGKYSLQPGIPQLKKEIAKLLIREKNIPAIDPEKEIFVSCGAMEALACAISCLIEKGDEAILFSPTYTSYIEQVIFCEGKPVFVPFLETKEWKLDINSLKKAITKKTKVIIFSNPVNPTGYVFPEEELREIAKIAKENNLYIVADETYDFLTYDSNPIFSLLSIPDMRDKVIGVFSFSKMFCMTGWRVGYMIASPKIISQVLKVHDAFTICAPTISQYAALVGLLQTNGKTGKGDKCIQKLKLALLKRRDLMCKRLDSLSDFFEYIKPAGAYYIFPKMKNSKMDSKTLALELLEKAKVITIPGVAFGPQGEGHLRMSFGGSEEIINEAFDRIGRYYEK